MEFNLLFANGEIPVIQQFRNGIETTVEIEVDK
jgi:hypothetical protein